MIIFLIRPARIPAELIQAEEFMRGERRNYSTDVSATLPNLTEIWDMAQLVTCYSPVEQLVAPIATYARMSTA